MRINIYRIPFGYFSYNWLEPHIWEEGYLEVEKFNRDECWHICNWCFHSETKPKELHSDIDHANADIIFHNLETGEYHLALPKGWQVENSLEDLKQYLIDYWRW